MENNSRVRDMYKSSKCTPQSIFFRLSIANIFVNRNFSTKRETNCKRHAMYHVTYCSSFSFLTDTTRVCCSCFNSTLNNIKIKYIYIYLQAVSREKQLKQCQVYLRRCAIMQYRDSHIEILNKKIYYRF